jgi:uncharacterized protein YycO
MRAIKMTMLCAALAACLGCGNADHNLLRDGDLIFHTSRSRQSEAVQRATGSPYSHMGVVFMRFGEPHVFEAVATARYTPIDAWINRGEKGAYVVKRLRNADSVLNAAGLAKLRREADRYKNVPYDLSFGWSDAEMYCSELAWKIYQRAVGVELGQPVHLTEFKLDDPLVKAAVAQRFRRGIPEDEVAISPQAMFDSPLLVTVLDKH